MNPVSLIHVVFWFTLEWPYQVLSTCFAALDGTIDFLPGLPPEFEIITGIWDTKSSSQIEIVLHRFGFGQRFADHLRTFAMSSFEYQPTSKSLIWRSILRTFFSLYLMNFSSQDNLSYCEHGEKLLEAIWGYTMACQQKDSWQKNQRGALLKLQAWYCLARAKWSPWRHSSCNHSGTCKRPPFLGSQSRRSFCLSAFSS